MNDPVYKRRYYLSHKEEYAERAKLYYLNGILGKKTKVQRYQLTKGEEVIEFNTYKELVQFLGFHEAWIRRCMDSNKRLKGYKATRVYYW